MLSLLLLVKAARGNSKISELVEKGLLTKKELEAIEPVAPFQRAMARRGRGRVLGRTQDGEQCCELGRA